MGLLLQRSFEENGVHFVTVEQHGVIAIAAFSTEPNIVKVGAYPLRFAPIAGYDAADARAVFDMVDRLKREVLAERIATHEAYLDAEGKEQWRRLTTTEKVDEPEADQSGDEHV